MQYSYLKTWTEEQEPRGWVISSCTKFERETGFQLGDGRVLRFILSSNDSFLFTDELQSGGIPCWQFLDHGIIRKIDISDADRIITLEIWVKDIYQSEKSYTIIFEAMSPKPNLIVCRKEHNELVVLDAFHKYTLSDNPRRQILPGLVYEAPDTGFVPKVLDISYPLEYGGLSFESMNDFLKSQYQTRLNIQDRDLDLNRHISHWQKELKKQKQKLNKQQSELDNAQNCEQWKVFAETLKFSMHQITKGDTCLEAINYFESGTPPIMIPLLPDKSPHQNLMYYLKKYRKARNGLEIINTNLEKTRQTILELETILQELHSGRIPAYLDLNRQQVSELKQTETKYQRILKFKIDEDWEILIGRKATENDFITTQIAKPMDWWFHTRIYHGSHILLRNLHKHALPEEFVSLCCNLAAWYSKAKFSSNVPVDYTQIRYVRKPRKAAPGFVTYTNHKSYYASPMDLREVREILTRKHDHEKKD
ncbi:MAG: NFACT RNA binding domain-containing protein [Candidatus Cloacimonetes bacterium]|nr:NFACT RNA binding domain-containing protein [Candidatus Cloacimonadota bacterium]